MVDIATEISTRGEAYAGSELERVDQFAESIGRIALVKPLNFELNFNEEQPVSRAGLRFLNYERESQPTLHLSLAEQLGNPTAITGFEPYISRGGKRSNHGVFFGNLQFENGQEQAVAVKPHFGEPDRSLESSLRDFGNNAAISQIGFYTLQPAGLVVDYNRSYSMTVLDESLTTLDSIDWSRFYPNINENVGMMQIWSQAARRLAALHSEGSLMHGDLAARNIAVNADNQVFFIDWEYASIDLKTPRDAEVQYGYSWTDLDVLIASLCRPPDAEIKGGIGVFTGKQGNWWKSFQKFFYDEYEGFRLDNAIGTKRELDVREELKVLRTELKNSFKMHHTEYRPKKTP